MQLAPFHCAEILLIQYIPTPGRRVPYYFRTHPDFMYSLYCNHLLSPSTSNIFSSSLQSPVQMLRMNTCKKRTYAGGHLDCFNDCILTAASSVRSGIAATKYNRLSSDVSSQCTAYSSVTTVK